LSHRGASRGVNASNHILLVSYPLPYLVLKFLLDPALISYGFEFGYIGCVYASETGWTQNENKNNQIDTLTGI
jgi:hypothetical protein